MDLWFLTFLSICFSVVLKLVVSGKKTKLPPGPPTLPLIGNPLWLNKKSFEIELILKKLRAKYGPIMTVYIGHRPTIIISNRCPAHQVLVQKGAVFSDRLPANEDERVLSCNQHNISLRAYDPFWRLLRRNISELLHPSRLKSFACGREWVLSLLIEKFRFESESGDGTISVIEGFQHAMFFMMLFMCFGQKLDERIVTEIEALEQSLLVHLYRLNVFSFLPSIGKVLFRKRWNEMIETRQKQVNLLVPLIRACRENQAVQWQDRNKEENDGMFINSYVHSLLNLEIPEEGRKLTEEEIVTMCSEFVNGGTDPISTVLEWIMANLVKNQAIQTKLFEEITGVAKEGYIKEEDLQKMAYLNAVIMEAPRRHPPSHFTLPHAVSEVVSIDGYVIHKNAAVNFMLMEMNLDEKVWKDPLEFRPERFLEGETVDITGSGEIKMMPFSAGRRICPGMSLAMLHLKYFVANLVKEFEWRSKDGEGVDLSEKQHFNIVMKNSLKAVIIPRTK